MTDTTAAEAARDTARDAGRDPGRDAARDAAHDTAQDAAREEVAETAREVAAAAYDDTSMLELPVLAVIGDTTIRTTPVGGVGAEVIRVYGNPVELMPCPDTASVHPAHVWQLAAANPRADRWWLCKARVAGASNRLDPAAGIASEMPAGYAREVADLETQVRDRMLATMAAFNREVNEALAGHDVCTGSGVNCPAEDATHHEGCIADVEEPLRRLIAGEFSAGVEAITGPLVRELLYSDGNGGTLGAPKHRADRVDSLDAAHDRSLDPANYTTAELVDHYRFEMYEDLLDATRIADEVRALTGEGGPGWLTLSVLRAALSDACKVMEAYRREVGL